ncbi:hypothetical protein EWY02_02155 [Enterococcus faecium]|nr:hypothetical protein [Enterococcus faecium]
MGFWIMVFSFILGCYFFFIGIFLSNKTKMNNTPNYLIKRVILTILGVSGVALSVYLAWPK